MVTPLIIATRLGIGVDRPEFYEYRLRLLEKTLARSIAAQTDNEKAIWILVVDIRAPKNIEEEITRRVAPAKVHIIRKNPLNSGMSPISKNDVRPLFDAEDIIIARVDDDDLLHKDFVKRTRATFDGLVGTPYGLSFAEGIDFQVSSMELAPKTYPWIGAGPSVRSKLENPVFPHNFNHTLMGEIITKRGGKAHVEHGAPIWIRTWHINSDSSEARGIRAGTALSIDFKWEDFGTTQQDLYELQSFMKKQSNSAPSGGSSKYGRLTMKSAILGQARELRRKSKEIESGSQRKDINRKIDILLEAMYSV